MGFYRLTKDGAELFVRLTPRAAHDAVDGVETAGDGRVNLAARVRAVPENGAANEALEKLIASMLELPRRSVSVTAGATARLKTLRVGGDPDEIRFKLAKLAMLGGGGKAG